jgi:hypothetical protein
MSGATLSEDDEELLALLFEKSPTFAAVWQGDTSHYADEIGVVDDNRVDWGLIRELLRATGLNAERTERLARLSASACTRNGKWDSARGDKNYLRYSIDRAIEQWDPAESASWVQADGPFANSRPNDTASADGEKADPTTGDVIDHGPPSGRVESSWPEPPAPEVYHGLAGDIVRTIAPHTEADPVSILVQTLVAFGTRVVALPISGSKTIATG